MPYETQLETTVPVKIFPLPCQRESRMKSRVSFKALKRAMRIPKVRFIMSCQQSSQFMIFHFYNVSIQLAVPKGFVTVTTGIL